ncbi:hypothetical protein [Nevskia soli]|uniref:hypothetical protein n=1 Tax=Nevskia soli TaxID=418856 RepID=UPI0012FBB67F|nr:hypothetical protein [Nevskia soli]
MNKKIEVRTDQTFGINGLLSGLPVQANWDCNVLRTMLTIGYLTAPPRYRGFNLSTFWAWIRYAAAISTRNPNLGLRRVWSEIDPHQKTILADDFGIGFPCQYLIDYHGFEDFADTSFLLETLLAGVVSHANRARRGPSKTPDYIAVDSKGHLHILECKGTQTSRAYLMEALEKGIAQKNNLSNGTIFRSCMVGGLYVPQWNSEESAELVFIDPELNEDLKELSKIDSATIARAIRRQSFSKALAAAGLWSTATAIYEGRTNPDNIDFVRKLDTGEVLFAGFDKSSSDKWNRTIEYRSLETDTKFGEGEEAFKSRLSITLTNELIEFLKETTSSNGILPATEVDSWIEKRVLATRNLHQRELLVRESGNKSYTTRRSTVSSTWNETTSAPDASTQFAAVTTFAGIQFALDRTAFI